MKVLSCPFKKKVDFFDATVQRQPPPLPGMGGGKGGGGGGGHGALQPSPGSHSWRPLAGGLFQFKDRMYASAAGTPIISMSAKLGVR